MAKPLAPQPDAASTQLERLHRTIRLRGSLARADVDAACARASSDLGGCPPGVVSCDVEDIEDPALPLVEVLARMTLIGRRNRHRMRLEHASPALVDLLRLCGLAELLAGARDRAATGDAGDSGREVGGKSEHREEPLGVEEEGDAGDAVTVDLENLE